VHSRLCGRFEWPVTALAFGRPLSFGTQSVSSASFVSGDIPVVSQPIPVVSTFSPELVSILKRVPSSSELFVLIPHLQSKLYLIVVDIQEKLKINVVNLGVLISVVTKMLVLHLLLMKE